MSHKSTGRVMQPTRIARPSNHVSSLASNAKINSSAIKPTSHQVSSIPHKNTAVLSSSVLPGPEEQKAPPHNAGLILKSENTLYEAENKTKVEIFPYTKNALQQVFEQNSSEKIEKIEKGEKGEKGEKAGNEKMAFSEKIEKESGTGNAVTGFAVKEEAEGNVVKPVNNIAEKIQKNTKNYPIIIPSCAHWFDMNEIHQIEKESLPEFFNSLRPSKTPEIYKKYRNYIIELYRQNPRSYLTQTACRRNLAGDVCAILRIHSFLEHWGLINFNVDPAHLQHNAALSNIQDAEDFIKPSGTSNKIELLEHEKMPGKTSELIFNTIKMLPKNYRPICDFCGIICGLVWFQQKPPVTTSKTTEIPEMILCIKCYTEGNFPNILSPNDFIKCDLLSKLSSTETQPNRQNWSTEETSKLLDLIIKNQDNWSEVEKQMGGHRTKEEIILHFLQLPLKNISSVHFLFENEEEMQGNNSSKLPIENLLENTTEPTVFSDFSNPLLQHVAIFKGLLEKVKHRKSFSATSNSIVPIKELPNEPQEQGQAGGGSQMEIEFDKDNKRKIDDFDKKLDQILNFNEKEEELLLGMEKETIETAKNLQIKEENKIRMVINLLIDLQLSKLESKLTYLEEFEKLIWYEKTELEVLQRMNIAERVNLAFKKNELIKQISSQAQNAHFPLHTGNTGFLKGSDVGVDLGISEKNDGIDDGKEMEEEEEDDREANESIGKLEEMRFEADKN